MSGVAGLRGVSASQDGRFTDKTKQLKQKLKFPKQLDTKIDFSKVNLEVIREWVAKRVTALLNGVEDDVLIGYIFEMMEQREALDPKELQVYLTGFLEKNTGLFMKELWTLLAQAQESPSGIPQQILDIKAEELKNKEQYQEKLQQQLNFTRSKYNNKDEPVNERHKSQEEGRREERRPVQKQSSFDLSRRRGPPQRESSFRQYKRDRSLSPPKYNRRKVYDDRYYSQYSSREFGRPEFDRKRGSSPPYKKRYRSRSPSPIHRRRSSSSKSPPPKKRQGEESPSSRSPSPKAQKQQKKYDLESGARQKFSRLGSSDGVLKDEKNGQKYDSKNGDKYDGKKEENNFGENRPDSPKPDFRVKNWRDRSVSPFAEGEKPLRENAPSPPTDKDQKKSTKKFERR
eukprot:TRINITY_DN133_c1_g2_i2.p3 TRINITY_DN133_c1_g2~~TRINITY_DN133_c1_g2_i2.p3  ORF type:complete len:400 (+),score=92.42 TRINITY_DN133_c1_g2_i2:1393-2592(+)